jgi:S-formylglutathione hydrolase FrmB
VRILTACAALLTAVPAFALDGTLVTPVTIVGPVTGQTIQFSVYLPPGYAAGSDRYPVVYHLHGLGGAHNIPNQLNTVSQAWADSHDGARRIETHVVREVLPYVDATWRTLPGRAFRAVQGFSMGGFGAAKMAAKFPDLFCAAVVYDGAMVTWPVVRQFHARTSTSTRPGTGWARTPTCCRTAFPTARSWGRWSRPTRASART